MEQQQCLEVGSLVTPRKCFCLARKHDPKTKYPDCNGYYYVRGFNYHPYTGKRFVLLEEIRNEPVKDWETGEIGETGFPESAFDLVPLDEVSKQLIQAFA